MQQLHPLRLQYELFSDANPMMAPVAAIAEQVRNNRRPVGADNPFVAMQENMSEQIVRGLDAWRDASEALSERTFLAVYGSPTLQAAVGIDPVGTRPLRKPAKSPLHRELLQTRIAEIKSRIPVGGLREALIRGLLYAGMSRGAIDERGFEAMRRIRQTHSDLSSVGLQGAGARAIHHFADRSGGSARRHPIDASAGWRDAAQGV